MDGFQLAGRTALITGAGGGLGRAISVAYAEAGVRIAAADISSEKAAETVEKIKLQGGDASTYSLDVTKRNDVEAVVNDVVQKLGSIDILVNSAGRAIRGAALEYGE